MAFLMSQRLATIIISYLWCRPIFTTRIRNINSNSQFNNLSLRSVIFFFVNFAKFARPTTLLYGSNDAQPNNVPKQHEPQPASCRAITASNFSPPPNEIFKTPPSNPSPSKTRKHKVKKISPLSSKITPSFKARKSEERSQTPTHVRRIQRIRKGSSRKKIKRPKSSRHARHWARHESQ